MVQVTGRRGSTALVCCRQPAICWDRCDDRTSLWTPWWIYWVGQKYSFRFPIASYGKPQMNFFGQPNKYMGFSMTQVVRNPPAGQETQETWVWSLGQEDPLEEEMATHSSILVWKIPWPEEPGGLQSVGLQRVGHEWATKHRSIKLLGHLSSTDSSVHSELCLSSHS